MTQPLDIILPDISMPPEVDRDQVLSRLHRVLDPELDESILSLGFVESVDSDDEGNLTVALRLPTYWCAANFSYLMASDVRNELMGLEGVRSVTVKLGEHFAAGEVENGAGGGKSFGEAFPSGGPDTLAETRRIFLAKGYFSRQERLLRALRDVGLSFEEIAALRVGEAPSVIDEQVVSRYLERRRELGIDCSDSTPLIVDLHGTAVAANELEAYYVRARTTRLAMEASGSLCSAMLQSRNENWAASQDP